MQSRMEMICEDVNQLCNNNSTMVTAPTAPEPKLTRTMIICEDVNRNDKDDNNDADNPLADHNLLLQEATPPDDQEGTLNMNQEHHQSLFCAPASPERSPSVLEQKPRVWRQQLGVPQRGFGSGNRADWDSSNRPVRLPSAASSGDKLVAEQQTPLQRLLADRSVFLSATPPTRSRLFTPICHASCVMKCADIMDQEEEEGMMNIMEEEEANLMSSQPPRLLPAPECADIFTSRGFIAAPQSLRRQSLESHQNYQSNQWEDVATTTSTSASGHASSGDFFNSPNCYYNNCNNNTCYNNECFEGGGSGGNSLENSFENSFDNYYNHNQHLSSSCEQYQHQNNFNSFNNFNNSFNNHNNQQQQQQNYSKNYLSSSPQQYLASTTTPSSSSSSSQNNNNSDWHFWIDDLIKQVQNEVAAEKKLFCMDRRPSTTFSDISGNVGSVQQQNVFDDDEKMVVNNNNNCATRFESGSVVSPSLYSQSSSGCSSSSSIGNSPYSFNGTIIPPSTTQKQKQPIFSNSDISSHNNNNKLNKRAKKNSLLTLSREELAERKKQQNRVAAQRYRNRRTRTLESEKCEIDELESRNFKMREELAMLTKEIEKLRGQLLLSR
ncbi:unnamed protein product [Meloidogyne enterolobii]|uniref:Uncharacterized protein n=1 Tax=Meloidogyne enterolobii TaxID=390850 RepID=A0ACB0XZC2_MELEN